MDRVTHKARLSYWVEAVHRCAQECAERGISKGQWIAEQGFSAKTYYNWQRRIREAASAQVERPAIGQLSAVPSRPILAELPVRKAEKEETEAVLFQAAAVLRVGGMRVELSRETLPELMGWLKETMMDAQ